MTKSIPQIQKYMTTQPHSIGGEQTLAQAEKMMREYSIRHLPVLEDGKVVGLVSDRDIKLVESLKDVDPAKLAVSEVARQDVYMVAPSDMLDDVVGTMAERKLGSALILDNHKLVGIFTYVDALRAFADLLSSRLTH